MLTGDREINKDFDINNFFLNLDFQNHEEKFTYKYPLIDQPSNYQMVVTKFFSKTSLPFIKLFENKKIAVKELGEKSKFPFDYVIRIDFDYCAIGTHRIEQKNNLFTYVKEPMLPSLRVFQEMFTNNTGLTEKDFPNSEEFKKFFYKIREEWLPENSDYIDMEREYTWKESNTDRGNFAWVTKNLYWYDSKELGYIYSPSQLLEIINNTLYTSVDRFLWKRMEKDGYKKEVYDKGKTNGWIYYLINDGRLQLRILDDFLELICSTNYTQGQIVEYGRILFSNNLAKYLKSIHLEKYDDEYMMLSISEIQWKSSKFEYDMEDGYGNKVIKYRIFDGEKINLMKWSDYIGIAVTSPDFPIKQQIYPHFNFDFKKDLFYQNRRRYVPYSELNIQKIGNVNDENRNNKIFNGFEDEYVNDQTKDSKSERILFLKYFNKDDDLNHINYENNSSNTSLKMDLINLKPLQEFTLNLFLIDRFNNFEPLNPIREGFDDVIKMQLLFQRIKGNEKENRYIIEPTEEPQRTILEMKEEEEEGEEDSFLVAPPFPIIKGEREEEQAPPEKKIYLGEDSEHENELY